MSSMSGNFLRQQELQIQDVAYRLISQEQFSEEISAEHVAARDVLCTSVRAPPVASQESQLVSQCCICEHTVLYV